MNSELKLLLIAAGVLVVVYLVNRYSSSNNSLYSFVSEYLTILLKYISFIVSSYSIIKIFLFLKGFKIL